MTAQRGVQGDDFRVGATGRARAPAAEHAIAAKHDGADGGVGKRAAQRSARLPECQTHGRFRCHCGGSSPAIDAKNAA